MIDFNIDEIDACCDSLIADGLEYLAPAGMNDSVKVKAFITRLRQAEKDAARYRWLREPKCELVPNGETQSCVDVTLWTNDGEDNLNHGETICMERMDSAIDEAMKCHK